ncbi:odorant-binding protein 2b-like [Ctenodactylus gundi]
MKTQLLTVVLCGLVAALPAQDPLSFLTEEPKIAGTLYMKALVVSKTLPEEEWPRKVFPMTATALEGRNLEAKVTFMKEGQCHEKKLLLQKSQEPGMYSAYRGKLLIQVEKLLARDHFIFYTEYQLHGKTLRLGSLVGKTPKHNPEALEEFKKFTQRKGLLQKDILIPEQRDGQGFYTSKEFRATIRAQRQRQKECSRKHSRHPSRRLSRMQPPWPPSPP